LLLGGGTGPTSNGHHDPGCSPDSNRIAFCFNHDIPSDYGIYLINKDGSGLCWVVTLQPPLLGWNRSWREIAFT
jgi:hypothetical protein